MWRSARSAFALIEMLLVVAILGVMVGVTMRALSPTRNLQDAAEEKEHVEVNQLEARVRDWQIGGGVLSGLTSDWSRICRYKEVTVPNKPTCVSFDGVQDDGYVDIIPYRSTSESPYTGYYARNVDGFVQVKSGFSPADIPGLELWLDAADAATITIASTVSPCVAPCVSGWKDKSSNQTQTTQTTAMRQPQNGALIGGLNAIRFTQAATASQTDNLELDLDPQWRLSPFFANFTGTVNELTLLSVVRLNNASETGDFITKSRNERIQYRFSFASGRSASLIGDPDDENDSDGVSTVIDQLTPSPDTLPHVYTWGVSQAAVNMWRDGVQTVTNNLTAIGSETHSRRPRIGIGMGNNAANSFNGTPFDGDVAEIVVYKRVLKDAERLELEDYLAQKWST